MARPVLIASEHYPDGIRYMMVEKIEDIDNIFCHAPKADLEEFFNDGKVIIINSNGGYCFFEEDFQTIL